MQISDGQSSQETKQEQRKILRQEYGWFHKSFVEILASYDPLGLIASGAPDDEYDIEVDAIVLRMEEAKSLDILSKIIYEEFIRCFGLPTDYPKTAYDNIAASVWDVYQRWLSDRKSCSMIDKENMLIERLKFHATIGTPSVSSECIVYPPVTYEELEDAERKIGFMLPSLLRKIYLNHIMCYCTAVIVYIRNPAISVLLDAVLQL